MIVTSKYAWIHSGISPTHQRCGNRMRPYPDLIRQNVIWSWLNLIMGEVLVTWNPEALWKALIRQAEIQVDLEKVMMRWKTQTQRKIVGGLAIKLCFICLYPPSCPCVLPPDFPLPFLSLTVMLVYFPSWFFFYLVQLGPLHISLPHKCLSLPLFLPLSVQVVLVISWHADTISDTCSLLPVLFLLILALPFAVSLFLLFPLSASSPPSYLFDRSGENKLDLLN